MLLLLILAHTGLLLTQAPAGGPVTDTFGGERFKTLIVRDGMRLGEELNRFAPLGYRITEVREDRLLLERFAHPTDHREYLVLGLGKWGAIERAMNDAETRGFRFVPRALFVDGGWSHRIAVVMEKGVSGGFASGLRYRIEWAGAKKRIRAARDGYHAVGMARAVWEDSDGTEYF